MSLVYDIQFGQLVEENYSIMEEDIQSLRCQRYAVRMKLIGGLDS